MGGFNSRNASQPMVSPAGALELRDFMADSLADLTKYHAAFGTIVTQLNADAGVTDTDYAAPAALTADQQSVDFEARNPVAPLVVIDVLNLLAHSAAYLVDLGVIRTAFAALTAKLDLDATVTDTDYNALDLAALTVVAQDAGDINVRPSPQAKLSAADITAIQVYSALVVADLAALRAGLVALTAQLDADAGVTDTTYASGNDPAAATVAALT